MSSVPEPSRSEEERTRRNILLGIANGALVQLGWAFTQPQMILNPLIYSITGSETIVGLFSFVDRLGLRAPQLVMSSLIEHHPLKKRFYIAASLMRITSIACLLLLCTRLGPESGWGFLGPFLFAFFLLRVGLGLSIAPFMSMIKKYVPSQRLGNFFGSRHLLGGVLSFLAGILIVQRVMESQMTLRSKYVLLYGLTLGFCSMGWIAFMITEEDEGPSLPHPLGIRQLLRNGFQLLRTDRNYLILLCISLMFNFMFLALAFFVPFGIRELDLHGHEGFLVAALALSQALSSIPWGWLSDKRSNKLCLVLSTLFLTASPLAAVACTCLPSIGLQQAVFPVYVLSLILLGTGFRGYHIGITSFIIESAPHETTASYRAFIDTMSFPLTLLPLFAGMVAEWLGMSFIMLLTACAGAVTFLFATKLADVRRRDQ